MNINFDDISYEEFDMNILNNIHIKPGDILIDQKLTFWYNNQWININCELNITYNIIDKIQLSDNITSNPYYHYNDIFQKIPDGQIMFSMKDNWPWFKYDKNLKINY